MHALLPILLAAATANWEYTTDPKLPNVLIIGDSISIGYGLPLRAMLAGKANVMRPMRPGGKAPANCSSTIEGLAHLPEWLGDTKWSVIHFNWGLHDLAHRLENKPQLDKVHGKIRVPLAEYEANLENLVLELKKTGAKLVWASTTKVPDGEPGRILGDDVKYNAAARRIMERHGIPIDDLHALSAGMPESMFLKPGNVHYTPEGYAKLAEQVARTIAPLLAAPK
jgi:lysophospholipase L1-like esterase